MTETDAGLVARLREAADDPTCTASYLLQEAADALASLSRAHEELKAGMASMLESYKYIANQRDEWLVRCEEAEAQVESLKAERDGLRMELLNVNSMLAFERGKKP
jgi:chromosome segregation ATPase